VRDGDVALVRHKALGKWLQPGGHLQTDEAPWDGAMREVEEEAGLCATRPLDDDALRPLDIDLHEIPAKRDEARACISIFASCSASLPARTRVPPRIWASAMCGGHRIDAIIDGEPAAEAPAVDPSLARARQDE
jgi:8-oxo-dGTP pyrophosphatase MutT (NUDIX family)